MCDVTRHNVHEVLPKFVELLASCEFYALDEEMTGIRALDHDTEQESPIAAPEVAYRVKRRVAQKYLVTQVGVSLFHPINPLQKALAAKRARLAAALKDDDVTAQDTKDSEAVAMEKPKYTVTTFNFHVVPVTGDMVINAETSQFLRNHAFDFHQWMDHGIPYKIPKWQSRKYEEQLEKFNEYQRSKTSADPLQELSTGMDVNDVPPPTKEEEAAASSGTGESITTGTPPPLHPGPPPIGFGSVYEALVTAKKPMIGHNCFADLLFLLAHFGPPPSGIKDGKPCPTALSPDYAVFRDYLPSQFPTIYDTKRIVSDMPAETFESTHLGGLYEALKDSCEIVKRDLTFSCKPFEKPPLPGGAMTSSYEESLPQDKKIEGITEQAHHAGYDAMMTGVVYVVLRTQLASDIDPNAFQRQYANQIALFRSLYATDFTPGRSDVYLPPYGAAVLELETASSTSNEVSKQDATGKTSPSTTGSATGTAATPGKLTNDLIEACIQAMESKSDKPKAQDKVEPPAAVGNEAATTAAKRTAVKSPYKYYSLDKKSAVVYLPRGAVFSEKPMPYIKARMHHPVNNSTSAATAAAGQALKDVGKSPRLLQTMMRKLFGR